MRKFLLLLIGIVLIALVAAIYFHFYPEYERENLIEEFIEKSNEGVSVRKIAFTTEKDWGKALYIISLDDGKITKLNLSSMIVHSLSSPPLPIQYLDLSHPIWLPNGRYIALVGQGEGGRTDIYILDLEKQKIFQFTKTPDLGEFPGRHGISPDGRKIAFTHHVMITLDKFEVYIYLLEIDKGNIKLVEKPNATEPAWSPDGKKIAFVADWSERDDIYIMDLETKEITRITKEWYIKIHFKGPPYKVEFSEQPFERKEGFLWKLGPARMPVFSPDGKKILFCANFQLFVMDIEKKELYLLTWEENKDAWMPTWSSDGKIYFLWREMNENKWYLYSMDSNGTNIKKVLEEPIAEYAISP